MSLNGSGVFNVNSAGQPVVAGTLITAAAFNAYTADVADALSTALYSDGQRVNNANQNMGGYKLTGLAAGSAPGDSVRYEQLRESGMVLQVLIMTDNGSSTSASSMTNITNSTKSITPKSNNSTLIIEVDFAAQVLAGGAGTNTLGYFQLYNSTAAANISAITVIGASSATGADLQTNASGRCSAVVANAALTTIGFLLRARYGATACQVSGTSHVWKITEVQN